METAPLRGALLAAMVALAMAGEARGGDEAVLEPVKVTAGAPEPPPSPGMDTVQHDTVDVSESETTWLTLEDVLESTPSVRVRSFGSPGSPSLLSVRGTDAAHTLVLLDGVPLNDAATGFVDLATVPVLALGQVTVIRGSHPAGTGPSHPGGVVLLESREPAPGLHGGVSLTLGVYPLGPGAGTGDDAGLRLRPAREILAFGAQRRVSLWQSWFGGSFGILASGSYSSSDGRFAYLSDGGTVYDLSDDHFLARTNNDHESASALVRMSWLPDMSSQLSLSGVLHTMHDGLPGIDVLPATHTSLERSRANVALSYTRWAEDLLVAPAVQGVAFMRLTSLEFADPLAELALSATDTTSTDVMGGVTLSLHDLRPGGMVLGGTLDVSLEGWRSSSRLEGSGDPVRALRLSAGLGADAAVRLLGGILAIEASLGASMIHDRLAGGTADTDLYLSPRAGIAISPLGWLRLTTSVAYAHRPPAFMELFGDGGTFRGSPDLGPERGVTADAGLELSLPGSVVDGLSMSVSAFAFMSRVTDLIVFIQNSQKTMVAENVDEASLRGVELTASLGYEGWFSVELGYTLLDPVDRSGIEPYDGLMMPGRPRHDVFLEAGLGHWGIEVTYLMDNISGGYVDRVHLDPISTRTIHTLKLGWEPAFARGLSLELAWWNVGNALVDTSAVRSSTGESYTRRKALSDVDGYPLPGTCLTLTLAFRR